MTIGREYHQATLLADGRVLVVGGSSGWLEPNEGPSILATAEVYDPATETFSPVGRSACARANDIPDTQLSTTLLPSGRVLVRGGTSGDQCQNPDGSLLDEIFDPWTGTFASVHVRGPVEVASVVLLHPDLVLRYDLRTGTPTDITPQPAALVRKFGAKCRELRWGCRSGMTTTRLTDGRVLLAGGSVYADSGERRVPQVAAELLDPGSGVVVRTGPLVEPRRGHTATLLADGRILLIGGVAADRDSGLEAARSIVAAEIFTPAS
jgi:hypothetical protein